MQITHNLGEGTSPEANGPGKVGPGHGSTLACKLNRVAKAQGVLRFASSMQHHCTVYNGLEATHAHYPRMVRVPGEVAALL